jgi:hypothetical protein
MEFGRVEPPVGDGCAQQLGDPVAVRVGRTQRGRAGRMRRHRSLLGGDMAASRHRHSTL